MQYTELFVYLSCMSVIAGLVGMAVGISEGCFIFDFASLLLEFARPI